MRNRFAWYRRAPVITWDVNLMFRSFAMETCGDGCPDDGVVPVHLIFHSLASSGPVLQDNCRGLRFADIVQQRGDFRDIEYRVGTATRPAA